MPSTAGSPVAVYCGSSIGKRPAYAKAAISVGTALAKNNRPLVYGGLSEAPAGTYGLMGVVSHTVLQAGGRVTGVIPYAILMTGGEADKSSELDASYTKRPVEAEPSTSGASESNDKCQTIVVNSMHERKVEMAKRSCGFIGLPGGFGTFDEVFEVTTWTQLGIHDKPVVLVNVLNYYDPLRKMIQNALNDGFIQPYNVRLVTFVDGPEDLDEHESYDWGTAALRAIDDWKKGKANAVYDWTKQNQLDGTQAEGNLAVT
ncbi:hypothetical protein BT96DRAFT_994939 [Gymnopus androsaceus JB14]|uniref:Lysine decarboxylase n=1 Tax=Gymnopus androsaceus JB14 TaxID=1447944 RepID=A0A6A4HMM2_9AGAR|nr:hypothetical protein BT96DRAFT_994939 [Gymnopus androsaceus JB14]